MPYTPAIITKAYSLSLKASYLRALAAKNTVVKEALHLRSMTAEMECFSTDKDLQKGFKCDNYYH